ncbi:MAG: hypothetical protein GXP55_26240 [Deltaproteobacteria bacterium]|nr:hypothetical protein [Deltaproteobacteria bacterium]
MFGRVGVAVWVVFAWLCVVAPTSAVAQQGDVAAAAAAFQQAQQAQLRGDYARAAQLFELAFSAAESQAALRSAIRNHVAAEDPARAATLSLRALTRYPGEIETRQLAQQTLDAHQGELGHLRVTCSAACVLLLDGSVEESMAAARHELFLAPGQHRLSADFAGRRVDERVVVARAGEDASADFEAPPAEPAPVEPAPVASDPGMTAPPPPPARGLSPAFFWTGAALTLVLGGVAVWSLVDTLDARDAYEAAPTQRSYNRGRRKERRLYAFTGMFGALGVGTLLLGVLWTRWRHEEFDDQGVARFDLQLGPGGGRLTLRGRF